MFTGLIQGLGQLQLLSPSRLRITCPRVDFLSMVAIGDSIAVDGACLTVEEFDTQGFTVTVSPETLQRTTLGERARRGESVNLEPSLRVGDKLGGHFVTGHVDGVGSLEQSTLLGDSWEMIFRAPQAVAPYLVPKGSIAVNGISLTVASCHPQGEWFSVAVIPHTYQQTTLGVLGVGDQVNVEADLLGKYARQFLAPYHSLDHLPSHSSPEISLEFLQEHGFG